MDRGDRALQNVIAQAAGLGAQGQGSAPGNSSFGAQFIASPQWAGPKPGYYFGRGAQGQGYYPDSPGGSSASQAGGAAEAEAAAKQPVLSAEALLEEAEERANIQEIQVLDAKGLRRLVTAFEKKYKDNLEQRMRHADEPEKFLESEVDLDETVKGLAQVAGSPELYPLLVELNPVPTLMACLGHENTDIAADALDVLRELTDADAVEEYGEEARLLAGALLEANVLELLVQRLASLNEKVPEEAAAVFNCLHTFENLIEVQPDIAEQVVDKTRLLKWLLARLRPREFDGNKLQASELLAVLLQGSEKNQRKLADLNGVEGLLQCVALYKGRDPGSAAEEELMQNCFDVLCAALMQLPNKQAFIKAEGVELMWLMMQNKRQSRYGALKLLDFACTRFPPACEKLVDLGGLKHLFAAFMGKARIKGPSGEREVGAEVEQRCLSLLSSLVLHLGPRGGRRERLGAKFVEAEYEKADRLVELYFKFSAQVAAREAELLSQAEEEGEGEVEPAALEQAREGAGLYSLQQAALLLAWLWALGDAGLRRRLLRVLHQKAHTLGAVRAVLQEYQQALGDGDGSGPAELEAAQRHNARVLEVLGGLGGLEGGPPPGGPPLPSTKGSAGGTGAGGHSSTREDPAGRQTGSELGAAMNGRGAEVGLRGQRAATGTKLVAVKAEQDGDANMELDELPASKPVAKLKQEDASRVRAQEQAQIPSRPSHHSRQPGEPNQEPPGRDGRDRRRSDVGSEARHAAPDAGPRERDVDEGKAADRDRDRQREGGRGRDKPSSKESGRERDKDRDRDAVRGKNRSRSRSRSRERDRTRPKRNRRSRSR